MRTRLFVIGTALLAAVSMAAGMLDAAEPKPAREKEKAPAEVSTQGTEKKDGSFYEYSGIGRRDPFTSLIQKKSSEREKAGTALESYDTAEMKLIAILWDKNRYYAVLSLPDNKSYTVKEGDKIGTSSGMIKKINKDSMVISERVKDARGRINPKDKVIKLRSEEE
jgi:Tfp pilus assembly protein PilP